MLNQFKDVYDKRWKSSKSTDDQDILSLKNPDSQVRFFYFEYNTYIQNILLKFFNDLKSKDLLEVGCGRATSSIFLHLNHGIKITPTDFSTEAIKIAKENLNKYNIDAKAKVADIYKLPFDDNSFDVVLSLGLMEHITKPLLAFKEFKRVLRPNGIVISMIVPETKNIQNYFSFLNSTLNYLNITFLRNNSKIWLDKTQSKTSNVYRSTENSIEFYHHLKSSGFKNIFSHNLNPFPTIAPIPKFLDKFIVKFYMLILWFRKILNKNKNPFICSEKISRCFFIIGSNN